MRGGSDRGRTEDADSFESVLRLGGPCTAMHGTPLSSLALIWSRSKPPGGPDALGVGSLFPGRFHGPRWTGQGFLPIATDECFSSTPNDRPERCVPCRCRGRPPLRVMGASSVRDCVKPGVFGGQTARNRKHGSTMRSNSAGTRSAVRRVRLVPVRSGGPKTFACVPTLLDQIQGTARQRPGGPSRKL